MGIHRIELNLGQKSANPFKTTRKSTTNPFKYNDFEGNTIDPLICADVLVSFKGKENKLKMITSSVMGSMVKLRSSITEPIAHFVNRVKESVTTTWNTAVEKVGLNNLKESIHTTGEKINSILSYDVGKGISDSLSGLGKGLSEKLPSINIANWGKDIIAKWDDVIGKIHHEGIPSGLPVAEYRALWLKEIESVGIVKEAA